MPRTLADLAEYLESVALMLPQQRTNEMSKQAAEIILIDLLRTTPVDTSKALSNWQASLETPSHAILPPYVPGTKGSSALPSQELALAAGRAVLSTKTAGQAIYISNPLPYIRRLNEGHSQQAPAGFVERAILLGRLFTENPASFGQIGL